MIHAALVTALLVLPAAPTSAAPTQKVEAPPGLVLIKGGNTKIGTSVKEAERLIREDEHLIRILTRETPEHTVKVANFFLGVTEVTNEQYAAYVRASGARPSEFWAEELITAASQDFLREQGEARQAAKEAGETLPDRKKFDRSRWWRANWEGKEWSLPAGSEMLPVIYVDYQDARAYTRWAGLRLMTEFEYQRAVRGNGSQLYPWGEEFDSDKGVTDARHLNGPVPQTEGAEGANPEGVRHLAGNVWEWTSSPFIQYPKFKSLKIKVGKGKAARTLDGLAAWDANERVAVGGSFQNPALACRATTRRPTERNQSTDSLGFRVAASTTPGFDIASSVLKDDVPPSMRPEEVEYDMEKAQAMDKWATSDGQSTGDIENYGVITGYEYVLFVPTMKVKAVSVKGLRELAEELGTVQLGVLTTTRAMIEPELQPGTYIVSFLGAAKGKAPEPEVPGQGIAKAQDDDEDKDKDVQNVVRLPDDYDWTTDNLIYYLPEGEPVAWTVAPKIEYTRPKKPEIKIADIVRQIQDGVDEDGLPIMVDDPVTTASFATNTWVKVSNKAFHYSLRFMFERGAIDNDWRH